MRATNNGVRHMRDTNHIRATTSLSSLQILDLSMEYKKEFVLKKEHLRKSIVLKDLHAWTLLCCKHRVPRIYKSRCLGAHLV